MQDIDARAFGLYERIITSGPGDFGPSALQSCVELAGAESGFWITWHHDSRNPGLLVTHNLPADGPEGLDVAGCESLRERLFDRRGDGPMVAACDPRKPALRDLAALLPAGTRHCLAAGAAHRGGRLYSLLAFASSERGNVFDARTLAAMRAFLPHLTDAATLAQRALISRDLMLQRMGRPSRGMPALVDAEGGIYEADEGFTRLLADTFTGWDRRKLPVEMPVADPETREVKFGSLRARVEPMGRLFLVHVRRLKPLDVLSRRERDVARGIVSGLTLKTIGQRLGISASTVANHAARIYEKLGIHNRDQLVDISSNAASSAKRTTG
jgi:DNA-binding CsgD family transcriptional regulator